MSSILYPVYCILILMYWYTDVCTALYITVSLYINHIQSVYLSICTYPICLSVNLYLIFESYPNLYLIFEKLEICTSISTKSLPQVSNITYHISNIKYMYPLYCILYPVSWCTDVLMSVLLYISLYRCISMMYWCL